MQYEYTFVEKSKSTPGSMQELQLQEHVDDVVVAYQSLPERGITI